MLGEVALDLATFVFFAVLVPAALYGLWMISCDLFDRWWWHR